MSLVMRRSTPRCRQRFINAFRGAAMGVLAFGAVVACAPSDPEPETPGTQALTKLITADQYSNTLSYIFGPGVDVEARFAPMPRTEGLLCNSLATAGVSSGQVQTIQSVAGNVASQVVDIKNRDHLVPCHPESVDGPDQACAAEFVSEMGRLLFRRALTDDEVAVFAGEASAAAEDLEDFYGGLEVVLEGLLIHPEVLFITENVEPDPDNPEQLRLDSYSLASRLRFFLWNAGPGILYAYFDPAVHALGGDFDVAEFVLFAFVAVLFANGVLGVNARPLVIAHFNGLSVFQ